jgi:hypothetical protein
VSIVILGTDAVLAALPATPVQLAHACLRAGFANVIPASWGDELIAAAVLRRLPQFGSGPVIQCSCPIVAHRLLTVGGDLRPVLLPLVSPPVAVARYIRSIARPSQARITYIGACPGAVDDSIDIRMTAESLIEMLAEREIVVGEQPVVFESIIPPDRRRFQSQPGGVPTAEALWNELGSRTLVELDGDDFVTEVAQHVLTGKSVLIDAAVRLGCACSGAVAGARAPRATVIALEPPRSHSAIIGEQPSIELDLPLPAAPRTPVDVVAVPSTRRSSRAITPAHGIEITPPLGSRTSPPRATPPVNEPRPARLSLPVLPRQVLSAFPIARDVEGKSMPRAYMPRRRSSPKGISVTLPPEEATTTPPPPLAKAPAAPEVTKAVRALKAPAEGYTPELSPSVRSPEPPIAPPHPEVVHPVVAPSTAPATSEATPLPTPSAVLTPPQGFPEAEPAPRPPRQYARDPREPHHAPAATMSRGQIVFALIAVAMIAICATTVVAVIVGRSVTAASLNSPRGR